MKQKFYFMLIFTVVGIASLNAQVRIGGLTDPNNSAMLDLNPDDQTAQGNATLGLALPRVKLKNTQTASPLTAHVPGMTVYNVATSGDVVPGVYFNNGSKWLRQADFESVQSLEEKDGIIGNEVTNATTNGGLTRSGSGTNTSPYTLGIAAGGVTNSHIANNAVTSDKIANSAITPNKVNIDGDKGFVWMEREDDDNYFTTYEKITSSLIADNTITNSDINATAAIAGSKLADKSVSVGKINTSGTASASTYLRGDGTWTTPAGDGQGVTSVSGSNGITVTNGTTTPTVSLPDGGTTGNVLKWNGSAWASNSDINTTYNAGTGLYLNGTTFHINNAGITTDHLSTDAVSTLSKKSFTMKTGTVGSSSWFETTSSNQMYVPGGIYVVNVDFLLSSSTTATLYVQIHGGRIITIENPISSISRELEFIYINDTSSNYSQTISFYLKTASGSVTISSGTINLYRIGKL
jgi:hypothetical protein